MKALGNLPKFKEGLQVTVLSMIATAARKQLPVSLNLCDYNLYVIEWNDTIFLPREVGHFTDG